jgi:hypothetical protein
LQEPDIHHDAEFHVAPEIATGGTSAENDIQSEGKDIDEDLRKNRVGV